MGVEVTTDVVANELKRCSTDELLPLLLHVYESNKDHSPFLIMAENGSFNQVLTENHYDITDFYINRMSWRDSIISFGYPNNDSAARYG